MEDDGSRFKITLPFQPYFYLLAKKENIQEVTGYLSKKYAGSILKIEQILKEDLDLVISSYCDPFKSQMYYNYFFP